MFFIDADSAQESQTRREVVVIIMRQMQKLNIYIFSNAQFFMPSLKRKSKANVRLATPIELFIQAPVSKKN